MSRWSRHPDRRCLRGLKHVYRTEDRVCPACFGGAVHAALPGQVLAGTERMGEVEVSRAILQFVFELRWGLREREVEVHHRTLADPAARDRTYRLVEGALEASLHPGACGHG